MMDPTIVENACVNVCGKAFFTTPNVHATKRGVLISCCDTFVISRCFKDYFCRFLLIVKQ